MVFIGVFYGFDYLWDRGSINQNKMVKFVKFSLGWGEPIGGVPGSF